MLAPEQMAIVEKHQDSWPVNVEKIARELGISVYDVSSWPEKVSGMIKKDEEDGGESGYAIYVNENHPSVRQRFTIAHEIGHFLLHEHLIGEGLVEDVLWRAGGLSNRVETEANRMAARILMPSGLIKEAYGQKIRSIKTLAKEFEVSEDAMSIRILGVPYRKII
ncbi:MAG: ImmA/IrrE family metallo-endopeptidase [Aestuariivita sp.]|nr:ImmA/IrrE family metallo-endopeptidase [Aestuariivita sp.]